MNSTGDGPQEWTREVQQAVAWRICEPARIAEALEQTRGADSETVEELLRQARSGAGLTPEQAAALIQVEDAPNREKIAVAARELHERFYARRVHILTPVCPSNRCINDCRYCPLRRSNARLRRSAAGTRDLQREIAALLDEGYRHVTLVYGEDRSGLPYLRDTIWATYGTRSGLRQIQRVDINLNPLRPEELRELSEAARLGTYEVFQETYHPETYARLHPEGPKADYAGRLTCHDRALQAGVQDVGLGVLLGAYDFRFDVVAVLAHARYLEETYGVAPRTITYPRMTAAREAPASQEPSARVSDEDFRHVVAVTRLARPCTDLSLCTPASRELRRELYGLGISQVSVGSSSYPGVYSAGGDPEAAGSLRVGRPRGLEELVYRMCEAGVVPNFCVACYSARGRQAAEQGRVECGAKEKCAPNSLLALKEYLLDHASVETQTMGDRLIQQELARLPEKQRSQTLDLLEEVESGLRRVTL